MINRLIENYVKKMDVNDIISFATKNGIELNDDEVNLVYNHIKKDWKTIVYGNPREILDDVKRKVSPLTYQKIENLYVDFRERYQSYL